MTEEKKQALTMETFDTLCKMFENKGWNYEKSEDKLSVKCGISGEDFNIRFHIRMKPKTMIVSLLSPLPFKISEAKREEAALAVAAANYGMASGSFDYDASDGEIVFRLTTSYNNCKLSEDVFEYMVLCSYVTIDSYISKFFMFSKGIMTLEEFISKEKQK